MVMTMYEERTYRTLFKEENLHKTHYQDKETDLLILSSHPFDAHSYVEDLRKGLEAYIGERPDFLTALSPLDQDPGQPDYINHMIEAGQAAGVGPMAAVAGMVSHYLGESMKDHDQVMIENGGDIYLRCQKDKVIGIYAGQSPFSNRVGIKVKGQDTPLGICTSAGSVGHSLSFGKADAVVVLSKDTLLADATATAIGNLVKEAKDIRLGLEFGKNIPGIIGLVIILGEDLGAFGDIELVQLNEG